MNPTSSGVSPFPDSQSLSAALDRSVREGDLTTLDLVLPELFDELKALAHRQLAREFGPITLQTTELVNEAYLRLVGGQSVTAKGRAYFFAAASRAMRQVLVDAARRRKAAKRGAGAPELSLENAGNATTELSEHLLELDAALVKLNQHYPRHSRVVECRFFGGMTVEDTAAALGVSPRTVKADWAMARAWLYDELHGSAA